MKKNNNSENEMRKKGLLIDKSQYSGFLVK